MNRLAVTSSNVIVYYTVQRVFGGRVWKSFMWTKIVSMNAQNGHINLGFRLPGCLPSSAFYFSAVSKLKMGREEWQWLFGPGWKRNLSFQLSRAWEIFIVSKELTINTTRSALPCFEVASPMNGTCSCCCICKKNQWLAALRKRFQAHLCPLQCYTVIFFFF